jgi:hypothetical protein
MDRAVAHAARERRRFASRRYMESFIVIVLPLSLSFIAD